MSFIIEVKTNTGFENESIHYIKIARLGRFVCGTYDLITTSFIEKARKFKTKKEAQNFIDKIKDLIETCETLTIKEVEIDESSNDNN